MTKSYILAFDFGEVRIGVAGGSAELGIATPLTTITGNGNTVKFTAIAQLLAEWQPKRLLVGLPTHADGSEHELTRLARKFAQRLHGRFNLPVTLVDERYTSVEADQLLSIAHAAAKNRQRANDQVAAMQILQDWFAAGMPD
jgi:putative holliday junction resolvase